MSSTKAWIIQDCPTNEKVLRAVFVPDKPLLGLTGGYLTVRVTASALNHRDYFITQKLYPGIRMGSTLGGDGCGIVVEGPRAGQSVIIDPMIGWGPQEEPPLKPFGTLGTPFDGTFAEYVVVPEQNLYPKPPHLTDIQSAAIPLAGVTAFRALVTKGAARAGQHVLVTGIGGGVAVFAAQFAVALGCKVYVTSSSNEKIHTAVKVLRVQGGVQYMEAGWSKRLLALTQGQLMDLVVDGAGGPGLNECFKCLRPGGKVVTIGSTTGPHATITMPALFLRQCELIGSAMGSPRDFAAMLALITEKNIVPLVDSVYPLEKFPEALDRMRRGQQMGKICMDHTLPVSKI